MARLVSAFFVLLLASTPAGCGRTSGPVEFDFPIGDQCAFQLPRRPEDCVLRPPCMYTDAVIHLRKSDSGELFVTAWRSEELMQGRRPEPIEDRPVESPESAALHLPEMLRALDVPSRPISEICIVMRVDQNVSFGDFIAFYRALENVGVRKVQLFADLVGDPMRFVRVSIPSGQSRSAFFEQMRVFAGENGYEFAQSPWIWDAENRFEIVGDGLTITVERGESSAPGTAFRAMLELYPQADGTLPTEPRMDDLLSAFTAAVERTGGTAVTVAPGADLE